MSTLSPVRGEGRRVQGRRVQGWEEPRDESLLKPHPLCLAASPAQPCTLLNQPLHRPPPGTPTPPHAPKEGWADMGVEDKRGRQAVEDGCLAGSAGHAGSRSWRVVGGGDSAREAWHGTGAEGRKGERTSRQLGMSHNYRRKIRPEPGSLCL